MLTEFSHWKIFPWGQDKKVPIRPTRNPMRYAKKGQMFMRCGKCGNTDFTAIIEPTLAGDTAKIRTLACTICDKPFEVNESGELGGKITLEKADARKREEINGRPDT